MTETAKSAYLTPEAHDRLKGELEHLSTEGRVELSKKIEAARLEGDLRENGGYHAAKEEQGKMEARIRQLTQLLESAIVGETPPPDDGIVEPGMVVTVEMFDEEETFLLGHREIQDHTDLHVFSEASPLGRAVNGRTVGETVSYVAPNGKTIEVKILNTSPYAG
ncbi:MAG: transcription elongation factor GreA [Actinomycetales bacterium]|uniref:Transcription elongation factor GreA n=1 Tax=Candidatus Phosphoribacter hodrii TaxID=2953743 RepID=A0A935M2E9_9MICO|nr:transcription elongation factor GreA [Candidatus Phosphoribacter hodrii]MBP8838859.1 transcription elongation factor GreA [Dermatophilaceae bacterium]OPZ51361.1 MAG: Transcription elongation factor GreA [bacterium ADurb.BinA028]MBL0005080.1 transcription elongation factor GreA [Candidatus Phosphoribacter hodrii]HNV13984.1 transcription elongation factor GreA [Dermatophilaceae bacterium]